MSPHTPTGEDSECERSDGADSPVEKKQETPVKRTGVRRIQRLISTKQLSPASPKQILLVGSPCQQTQVPKKQETIQRKEALKIIANFLKSRKQLDSPPHLLQGKRMASVSGSSDGHSTKKLSPQRTVQKTFTNEFGDAPSTRNLTRKQGQTAISYNNMDLGEILKQPFGDSNALQQLTKP